MKYPIFDCSPEAAKRIKSRDDKIGLDKSGQVWAKYPFRLMEIGQCFCVPFTKEKENSIRVLASQQKAKTGKTFCVIRHNDLKIFEVARVA